MSRLPALNFLVVLLLITFLALRHSASVFAPNGLFASYDFDQTTNSVLLTEQINALPGQLYDFWRRATIIKKWSAEHQAVTWENMFESHGAAGDLIDARFHVANAEVFSTTLGANERARVELARADRDVKKALPCVADKIRPVVNTIRKELAEAEIELATSDHSPAISAGQIITDLDQAISCLQGVRSQSRSRSASVDTSACVYRQVVTRPQRRQA